MKIETYEKAEAIRKQRKSLEAARDAVTKMIDNHGSQLDMIDDNDAAARVNQAHVDTRNSIESMIAELDEQFDTL